MWAVGDAVFQKIFSAIGTAEFEFRDVLRDEFCIIQTDPKFYAQGEHGIYIPVDAGEPESLSWDRVIQCVGQGDALLAGMTVINLSHVYFRLTSSIAILVEWLNGLGSVMGLPTGL